MKKTMDISDFHREFKEYNRLENFTYEGRIELFDWLIELEEGSGVETELDVIGLCCDFRQGTIKEILEDYSNCCKCFEDLRDKTIVMYVESPKVADTDHWEQFDINELPLDADEKDEHDEYFNTEIIIANF